MIAQINYALKVQINRIAEKMRINHNRINTFYLAHEKQFCNQHIYL